MRLLGALALLLAASTGYAAEPVLIVELGGLKTEWTRTLLLARPDAAVIDINADVAYGGPRRYRAVPMAQLLAAPNDDVLEATASDGFVAQLPLADLLARGPDRAEAWLAIEEEAAPWPKLKGKDVSAGPFYIVWLRPHLARIGPEQWPYQLARLTSVAAPHIRWPQIAVAENLPADDPARQGQALFIKHCFACHRLNGGGTASVGPDLNRPANPTEYFQGPALRAYIRNPGSLRSWPEQKMPGFDAATLDERELDALLSYLRHMAPRKSPP